MTPSEPVARRRYFRSAAAGGLGAVGVFVVMLWNNGGLFAGSLFGGFYETQAHAFRQLRWYIPRGSLGIEGFVLHHRTYEYYGPWPALVRMPLMLFFPSMNGKWTLVFMLVAFVLALVAVTRLGWQIRTLVRGGETPVSRVERWWVALFTFGVGTGSVLLFLASQAWVYHEAEIWGASLSIAAFAALAEFLISQRWNRLVWASLFATLAINSRASVGFGPIVAVIVVGAATLLPSTARLFGLPDALRSWRSRFRIGFAAGIPIVTYMYVNYSKFGSLFVFPSKKQIFSNVGVYREQFLAQNHNTLFGLKFFPTAAVQYFRPDALRFQSLLPFVNFPGQANVIGKHVLFDTIEPTSSVPSSMPVLAILGLIGLVCLVSRRRGRPVAPIRAIALGAFAGAVTVVPYSYIAERYMSDFVPLLVVLASIGCAYSVRFVEGSRRRLVSLTTVLVVGVVFALFVNVALAYAYHNESDLLPEGPLTAYVENQYFWYDGMVGGTPPYVKRGSELPRVPLARGTTFVVGACDGVYWSQGNRWPPTAKWLGLARTRATGRYDMRVKFSSRTQRSIQPLVVRGSPGSIQAIAVDVRREAVRFGLYSEPHTEWFAHRDTGEDKHGIRWGRRLLYKKGKTYNLEVVMDSNNGKVSVVLSGYPGYVFFDYGLTTPQLASFVVPTDRVEIGKNTVGAPMGTAFQGSLREVRQRRPGICKLLDQK